MTTAATTHAVADPHAGHADHSHDSHLAHHFDNTEQQYTASKLGMWVFLGTELLMFGGLFCAYSIYRSNYPEVFAYAHQFLDRKWGAINTVILIASSLTMAWGVRAAQLGQQFLLRTMLIVTILGGAGFMVIKTIEYTQKYEHQLFPGRVNKFSEGYKGPKVTLDSFLEGEGHSGEEAAEAKAPGMMAGSAPITTAASATASTSVSTAPGTEAVAKPLASSIEGTPYIDPNAGSGDAAKIVPNFGHPAGLVDGLVSSQGGLGAFESHFMVHEVLTHDNLTLMDQKHVAVFFSIYFMMTGLHGVHVLVGMGLITWVFFKSFGNTFGPDYYTPVDLVGLYWHLVDLIWIFLFPLLYLIH